MPPELLLSALRRTVKQVKILPEPGTDAKIIKVSPAVALVIARGASYEWAGSETRVRWMRRVVDKREIEDPYFNDPKLGFWSGRSALRHFGEPLPNAGRAVTD